MSNPQDPELPTNALIGIGDRDIEIRSALSFLNPAHAAALLTLIGALAAAALDTDDTLAADSDEKIASQKAVKNYIDNHAGGSTPGGSDTQVQYNDSGSLAGSDKLTFDKDAGRIRTEAGYVAGSQQVVGTQQPAISDASNAGSDPATQMEFNAFVAQFNTLLAALRAHGLIAS